MKTILAAIPLALLAACQSPAHQVPNMEGQCNLSRYEGLVGTSESSLDKSTLPEATRLISPGTPVTRDYRPYRLNIYINESGIIERVNCG